MQKAIGIVGGAGPYAGLDLLGKLLAQTKASSDQEHLTIVNLSKPSQLTDRTAFLLGRTDLNPAHAIAEQLGVLERMGAAVAGIPCNTAHAPPIFDVVLQQLSHAGSQIMFLNMVQEVGHFLSRHHPGIRRVGILATEGTYQTRLYPDVLEPSGFEVLIPDESLQSAVHLAIYDPRFGIKATGVATPQATAQLRAASDALQEMGAEAVILGCTELPLVIREKVVGAMSVIDPTLVLARALIREADPAKLRPLEL